MPLCLQNLAAASASAHRSWGDCDGVCCLWQTSEAVPPIPEIRALGAGQEVTQYTYFQQAAGLPLPVPSVEITYGLERIMTALQVNTLFPSAPQLSCCCTSATQILLLRKGEPKAISAKVPFWEEQSVVGLRPAASDTIHWVWLAESALSQ